MTKVRLNFLVMASLVLISWCSAGLAQSRLSDNLNARADTIFNNADTVKSSAQSPTGAMIRSLFVPGWGQFYNKKYVKAVLVFGAELGLLANSIYLNQKYKASSTELEREFYINNRNLSNWWLVGAILFSMGDAFVDAHLFAFDESPDLSIWNIMPFGTDADIGIKFSVCINF